MPELPEVETTRRGLEPHLLGQSITGIEVREPRLRWPVDPNLGSRLTGQSVIRLRRRGKYLLVDLNQGTLLLHLGMSGSLRFLSASTAPGKHDHVDVLFAGGARLRFHDPRRFGSVLLAESAQDHPLLRQLGPEPLGDEFTAQYLWEICQGRRAPIKPHLMNSRMLAGVGNIYANEALYRAGIHPGRQAGRIARVRFPKLVDGIREVLTEAIERGGTTLRDFADSAGQPGYFQLSLGVYGRAGDACARCGELIRHKVQGQRATYYCPHCQR